MRVSRRWIASQVNSSSSTTRTTAIARASYGALRLPRASIVAETPDTTSAAYQDLCPWVNDRPGFPGGIISFEHGGVWKYMGGVPSRRRVMSCPGDRDDRSQHQGVRAVDRNFSYS